MSEFKGLSFIFLLNEAGFFVFDWVESRSGQREEKEIVFAIKQRHARRSSAAGDPLGILR